MDTRINAIFGSQCSILPHLHKYEAKKVEIKDNLVSNLLYKIINVFFFYLFTIIIILRYNRMYSRMQITYAELYSQSYHGKWSHRIRPPSSCADKIQLLQHLLAQKLFYHLMKVYTTYISNTNYSPSEHLVVYDIVNKCNSKIFNELYYWFRVFII